MPAGSLLLESASPGAIALVATTYFLLLLAGTTLAAILVIRSLRSPVDWVSRITTLQTRPWTWREGLAVTGIIGLLICLGIVVASRLNSPREATPVILHSLALDLLGLAAIAGLVFRKGWSRQQAFGLQGTPAAHLKPALVFYLALMPFLFFASLVYQGLLTLNGIPPSLQEIALLLSGDHPLWLRVTMILMAVAIAPIFEETLFRGILLPIVSRRFGLGAGIFITSLLFASIHFHLPSQVPLMVVAAGFSLAYVYSGALWVPILMHGLFNGVNLAMMMALRH